MNTRKSLACLILPLAVLLQACGNSTEEQMERARGALAESRYDAAIIDLKSVLQEDAGVAEARWLLGLAYVENGDFLSAEKELTRAQRIGWNKNDIVPELAQVYLQLDKRKELLELDSEGLDTHAHGTLLAAQGLAHLADGKGKRARRLIDRALKLDPELGVARIAQVRELLVRGEKAQAIALLEELKADATVSHQAWAQLGDIYAMDGTFQLAADAYSSALENSPRDFSNRYKRALMQMQLSNAEAAADDVQWLLSLSPHHPGANYIQGVLAFQAQKIEEAVSALSVAEPVAGQYPAILYFLASGHLMLGHSDQAALYASRFHSAAPGNGPGRILLSVIRLQQQKYSAVDELLAPVLASQPNNVGALNLKANSLLAQGETQAAIDLLERVAELQPESAAAQVRLGAGMLLGGDGNKAQEHIENAVELDPEFQQADILLALNHMKRGDVEAALAAAKSYRRKNLDSVTPLNLLGRIYLESGDVEQAKKHYEKALMLEAGNPAASHQLALLAIQAGDNAGAEAYYQEVLQVHSGNLNALMQLAKLAAQEAREEQMLLYLQQGIEANPQALPPRLALARLYLHKNRHEQVASAFLGLDEALSQSPDVLYLTAMAQLSDTDYKRASQTLEQLMEETPENGPTLHLMGVAAAKQGNQEQALSYWRRALELDEKLLAPRIALARYALATAANEDASRHIEILISVAPQHADVLQLQAVRAAQVGDMDRALSLATEAHKQAGTTASLIYLAQLMEARQDAGSAQKLKQDWLQTNPNDMAVRTSLADSYLSTGRTEQAMQEYSAILNQDDKQVIAMNNLAWLIREDEPERALEMIQKAASLAPESAEVIDTLAVIQLANSQQKLALRSIDKALQIKPEHPSLLYHKAMILGALGQQEAAVDLLAPLVSGSEEFPEKQDAAQLLAEYQ